ncbi:MULTISPECIES: DNA topology modulation protein FlaR [Leuconostoc]|uniref:DNA topology modulation protein FlaR n=1 Tax=Leuconostoc kimchii TaxID=136609 RepID=A0ABX5SL33_9LACO|nr:MULTISPECIES: DNA topology modulation protein FlaR [Leuconostoc]AEJ31692.1 DNA topology modulation protein FLAR-related protein [Leuconostoc sp. C2]QBR46866.1 DNA topology modulation protein FlaR [Leuconostoc kimchii]
MKIRIIGPVGSGKTTFAYNLSHKMNVPVTSLDDLNWIRAVDGDKHRTVSERQLLINKVLQYDSWIIEGAQYREGQALFANADKIFVLDPPYWRNMIYIFKRWLKNWLFGGPPQYRQLRIYLHWQRKWKNTHRAAIFNLLQPYQAKVTVCKGLKGLTKDKN